MNRQLASRDALTGLPNRGRWSTCWRASSPGPSGWRATDAGVLDLGLVQTHQRHVRPSDGRPGAAAIAELARIELRAGDVLARWGGEEFLLLMPDTRRESAHAALDRMRVRVAEGGFEGLVQGMAVSFSAGITVCGHDEPYTRALERADQALYQAKNAGRTGIQWA